MASLVLRSEGAACVGLRAELQVGTLALIERHWRLADSRDDEATIIAVSRCDLLPHRGRRAQTLDERIAPRAGHEQEMGRRAFFESRLRRLGCVLVEQRARLRKIRGLGCDHVLE